MKFSFFCLIRENPYLQHFQGLHEYLRKDLFDPSMMVHFRKRISPESFEKINHSIICSARQQTNPPQDPPASPPNGKLLIDATCTPADITYPADLKLLKEAREKIERIIDDFHASMPGMIKNPRTYRKNARRC